ncbi:P-type DNA transfer ATPase VirB11 [Bartonella henselae]|uniref:Type IV secretion system ATPase VirB11 n=3 Tax=Bartonella TaxID=773 RepID=VRB11_BARHE|nr:P-type DNA transfer ATPase VirB11 [Bartonella henselae]Q9RNC7.1 RecName: Full=Type IV secretion system protein VirB11 [Bartonella henselae str. Houston-1]AAF00949.1 VirB11 homolog [Bartonella henselae str. Houston-1]ATP12781.1 type IV secretion system protein VirB11 [Bartonella henselae]ETS07501.1 type IV secretion system protein virB11 [Bartonella henselae JK 50]ETS07738.1 type IV secretion system protein virB11 [Bartonella henselae JK 51]MDM9990643.1 P-type DNA transfer ATPase VirB11 [Ba
MNQNLHTLSDETVAIVLTKLEPISTFLKDENLFEIVINRPYQVMTEGVEGWKTIETPALSFNELMGIAKVVASYSKQNISEKNPILSATLPGNERIQIVIPPAVEKNTISMTIRKPSSRSFSLEDLANKGLFSVCEQVSFTPLNNYLSHLSELKHIDHDLVRAYAKKDFVFFLNQAVQCQKNILIAGKTGSGKTTLSKALIAKIPDDERIITIEDTPELVVPQPNYVSMIYSKDGQGLASVGPKELLESALRMRPDRILLQELRDGTAFYYIRNVNSGHPGSITTVHASTALAAFEQMTLLVKESEGGGDLERDDIRGLLISMIDIIIQCKRIEGKFKVTEIYYDPFKQRNIFGGN